MIDGYAEGSDITIMNAEYIGPRYNEEMQKWESDYMIIVYKDNATGIKHHQITYNPEYTFYRLKEMDMGTAFPKLFFVPIQFVNPVTVPYNKLESSIAKLTGRLAEYNFNNSVGNKSENRKLHYDPRIFWSDTSIEDHFRIKFGMMYSNNVTALHKGYFDIECDTIDMLGDFVKLGECPINMISFHDDRINQTFSFILRNPKNPLIAEFEAELNDGRYTTEDIHEFVKSCVGSNKKIRKYGIENMTYKLMFYDDELDMLRDFFATVHHCQPDFAEGWNSSSFDLEYIIKRIENLNGNVLDIMPDQTWEVKAVRNYIDKKHEGSNPEERGDFTIISGNTVWIDQMIQFASRRKANIGHFTSFKLNDIGALIAGVRKLDYHNITSDLSKLPYLDFKTFVLYNIMDVVVQKCIETQNQDLEYIFSKCLVNGTSYKKIHRQTVYLINRMAIEFYKQGFVISNNRNKANDYSGSFQGALIVDPKKTSDFCKLKIGDKAIFVADNFQDYDFKSLYPSIMGEFNIAPNTQLGKIIIDDKIWDGENGSNSPKYTRGAEFMENYICRNPVSFFKRWFHLAGALEFLNDLKEYSAKFPHRIKGIGDIVKKNGKLYHSPLYHCPTPRNPIIKYPVGPRNPIRYYDSVNDHDLNHPLEYWEDMDTAKKVELRRYLWDEEK